MDGLWWGGITAGRGREWGEESRGRESKREQEAEEKMDGGREG